MKRHRVVSKGSGPSLTQRHFADAADVNAIMARYNRTGVLQGPGVNKGRSGMVFTALTGESYHEMLCRVQEAQGAFMALSPRIRKRFANNPENLFRFLQNSENLPEAIQLGLVDRENLSPESRAQLDLVDEAEAEDRRQFEEWRKSRANTKSQMPEPQLEDDESVPHKKKLRK